MKIAKAMKVQARLKGEIAVLNDRIKKCVSTNEANEFIEDMNDLLVQRQKKVDELMSLKNKVMAKNIEHNMFARIILLSELKNKIDLYRDLDIKVGIKHERYSEDNGQTFKAQITISERNDIVAELQNQINDITDELDIFNASTDV